MKISLLKAAVISASLALAACETPVETQTLPKTTFAHLAPLNIAVEAVEIENRYRAPSSNFIEDRFSTPPAAAVRLWSAERLKPVGGDGSGVLRIIINRASVKETELERDKSIKGSFIRQLSNRYDMEIDVDMEIRNAYGKQQAYATTKVSRSVTTREDISLNEREKKWFGMTEKAMNDFDRGMESQIRQYFASWLR